MRKHKCTKIERSLLHLAAKHLRKLRAQKKNSKTIILIIETSFAIDLRNKIQLA